MKNSSNFFIELLEQESLTTCQQKIIYLKRPFIIIHKNLENVRE